MGRQTFHDLRLCWLAAACLGAGAEGTLPGQPATAICERVALLADTRINESSGLAMSRLTAGVFWTLNDSGGEPCVHAFDVSGRALARYRVPDAINLDWEDLAAGPDGEGRPALFVADIGDNLRVRPSIQIYQVPEPRVDADVAQALDDGVTEKAVVWNARYPDGPHNAESLLVHPATGEIYILTKSEAGDSRLFQLPQAPASGGILTLREVGRFTFPPLGRPGKRPVDNCMATGACLSPDGTRLVVGTYCSLYEWRLSPGMTIADALAGSPPDRIEPLLSPQMEAVCYGPDSRTLWFTSERAPAPLYRVRRD